MSMSRSSRAVIAGVMCTAMVTVIGVATQAGASTPPATVSTLATSTYGDLYSMASDPSGDVFSVDDSTGTIVEYAGGSSSVSVLGVDSNSPIGVTYHGGLLYLSNDDGSISTFSLSTSTLTPLITAPSVTGGEAGGSQFVFDSAGDLFVANYSNNVIGEVKAGASTEVTAPITLTHGCDPWGLAVQVRTLLISCYDSGQLLATAFPVPSGGENAKPVWTPGLNEPSEITTDAVGNAYVANYGGNNLVEVHVNGELTSDLATTGTALSYPFGVTYTKGSIYALTYPSAAVIDKVTLSSATRSITCRKGTSSKKVSAVNPTCPRGYKVALPSVNLVASTLATSSYASIYGATSDPAGNLYFVDRSSGAVVKLTKGTSTPTVIATDPSLPVGIAFHENLLYIINAAGSIDSVAPSGGSLTTVVAAPSVSGSGGENIVFDSSDTMYVANPSANVIGVVAHNASVETTAGITLPTNCDPSGLAIQSSSLVISCYESGLLLRASLPVPQTGGETATVINSANALLVYPTEIAADNAGNLFIANDESSTIVELSAKSTRTTTLMIGGTTITYPWALTWSGGALYTSLYVTPNSIVKISFLKPVTTISCVKGKVTKRITGRGPTCPAGYKKK